MTWYGEIIFCIMVSIGAILVIVVISAYSLWSLKQKLEATNEKMLFEDQKFLRQLLEEVRKCIKTGKDPLLYLLESEGEHHVGKNETDLRGCH